MDNTLYVAMAGAINSYDQQMVNSNNLANVSTPGFRGDLYQAQSLYVTGEGLGTQVYVVSDGSGIDFTPGSLMTTDRDLDIAVKGKGWIAIQDKNGNEAYSRAGNMQIDQNGILKTASGYPVLGEGGPISVPPYEKIQIGNDGTISIIPQGGDATSLAVLERIKLVNPKETDLAKNTQGLIVLKTGGQAPSDNAVNVVPGAIENSNVNAVDQMVKMISASREFETQVKLMQSIDENDQTLARLLQV
jgi:flagellar basal-body rod protein FlgF